MVKKIPKYILDALKPKKERNTQDDLDFERFNSIGRDFLLENTQTHKTYSEIINSQHPWGDYYFNRELGSMGFSNATQGFVLALGNESLNQAQAMLLLNNEFVIRVNVSKDGEISVHLRSIEFFQTLSCFGIKWFKKE